MQIHAHHDAQPHGAHGDAGRHFHLQQDGSDDGHDDEDDLQEIEEEAHEEHHAHDQQHGRDRAAGQVVEEILDDHIAFEAPENAREHARADENDEDHGGNLHRGAAHRGQHGRSVRILLLHRAPDADNNADDQQGGENKRHDDGGPVRCRDDIALHAQVEEHGEDEQGEERGGSGHDPFRPLGVDLVAGQHDGAHRAHRGGFCRRGQPAEDGAEHGDDENERREERAGQPFVKGHAVALDQFIGGDGRGFGGAQGGEGDLIDQIHAHQHQAGQQRAGEKIIHRYGVGGVVAHGILGVLEGHGELIAQKHQDDGGRDDLAQGARGADGAAGEGDVVSAPQHGGQRQQAHCHHGGADNAGGGGQQRAHDRH